MFVRATVSGPAGMFETSMLVDTGASMSTIGTGLAQQTGYERLEDAQRETFRTANGLITCPIIPRTVRVGELEVTQEVAVSPESGSDLLGIKFFEQKDYLVDSSEKKIYVWSK